MEDWKAKFPLALVVALRVVLGAVGIIGTTLGAYKVWEIALEDYQGLTYAEREATYWRRQARLADPTRSIKEKVYQNLNVYQDSQTGY